MPLPLKDPKELEGRDGEKNKFREFFWDSVLLYVVYSITALAAIDALTEYIRGSNVACRVVSDTEYINNYCSGSLPPTQFFPVFIVVHAILIALPHYLWLNLYGEKFDFFFGLALQLEPIEKKEAETNFTIVSELDSSAFNPFRLEPIKTKGKYEEANFTIVSQLDSAFNTFRQNWMFPVYFVKLMFQLCIAVGGFISVIVVFTDFKETFDCPRNFNASDKDPFWPMNTTVQCVFTTLRLLSLIRIADLVLLALVILGFSWALLWSIRPHSAELGSEDIANFSFQTGLQPRFYVRDFRFPRAGRLKSFMQTVYSFLPWAAFYGPRISSDLDFMLLKLFRTNGGLGYTFRMTQVLLELRYLSENDHRCLNLHRRYHQDDKSSSGEEEEETVASDLMWRFVKLPSDMPNTWKGVYKTFKPIDEQEGKYIVLPNSYRGTILGLASFAPTNVSAMYICFGNMPSMGIPLALGRVFMKVNVINFNPDYWNDERPAELSHRPTTQITIVTCHEGIMTADSRLSDDFFPTIEEIWAESDSRVFPSDLIVVEPLYSKAQKTTVSLFLKTIRGYISGGALLVSLCPTEISGKKVVEGKDFFKIKPPQPLFGGNVEVKVALDKGLVKTIKKEVFKWPPQEYSEGDVSRGATPEEHEGEGTEESSPLLGLVVCDKEREIEDTCLFCHCCKRSCQCQEQLEKFQGSHFVSQLNCGGAFCSFEISVFKKGAALTGGEQRTE